MDATQKQIRATVMAAGQIGEAECTVLINGQPVKVYVPDASRYESAADSSRLAQLGVLASKPINPAFHGNN